jgi:pancreatic triacylglycerol lipase
VTRGRVNTIIGLDPAGPLFDINNRSERLAVGDAEYVECIHTNGFGTFSFLGSFGIGSPICEANFYPNGIGGMQPNCFTTGCSHMRAVTYFIESVINNKFWANKCQSAQSIGRNVCRGKPGAFMGGEPSNYGKNAKGIYYLDTNGQSPYGQGR